MILPASLVRRVGGALFGSGLRGFLTHAALLLATCVTLYPVLWVLKMALSPSQGFSLSINPIPTHVTLANFADVAGAEGAGNIQRFDGKVSGRPKGTVISGLPFAGFMAFA